METVIQDYHDKVEKLKPELLKMILDTYLEYNYDKNDVHSNTIKFSNENFLEEYTKGREFEKWNAILAELEKNQTSFNNFPISNPRKTLFQIVQHEYLKPNDIPPKTKAVDINYTFKSQINNKRSKIIGINRTSENLEKQIYFDETFFYNIENEKENENPSDLIKIIDYQHDNRLIFLDKYSIDFNERSEPQVRGKINLNTLEKRSDLLVKSRYNFIEKSAVTISKLIISLKKLAKIRKEKESRRTSERTRGFSNKKAQFDENSEKFRKIKEETRPYVNPGSKSPIMKNLDINHFKKFLTNVKDEKKIKEIELNRQKEEKIAEKLRKIKENMNENDFENEYNDLLLQDNTNKIDNNFKLLLNEEPLNSKKVDSNENKDALKESKEMKNEKLIIPKKKVNYIGLKMYLKEVLKNK